MNWSPVMRRDQLSGAWMLWLRQPKKWALRSNAARSAASCYAKEYDGGGRTVGELLATKTLSQKNSGRHPLPRATRGVDDHLYRRTGTCNSPNLRSGSRLVTHGSPHQGVAGLQSWTRENLGVRSAAGARWPGTDSLCRLAQLDELHRLACRH